MFSYTIPFLTIPLMSLFIFMIYSASSCVLFPSNSFSLLIPPAAAPQESPSALSDESYTGSGQTCSFTPAMTYLCFIMQPA